MIFSASFHPERNNTTKEETETDDMIVPDSDYMADVLKFPIEVFSMFAG